MKRTILSLLMVVACSLNAVAVNHKSLTGKRNVKAPKVRTLAPECLNPGRNPSPELEFPIGEKGTICMPKHRGMTANPDLAMMKVLPYLNKACSKGVEQQLYIVQDGNNFSLSRADSGDGTADSVKGTIVRPGDKRLKVAIIHNHPNGTAWPSEIDVESALKSGLDCYIRACVGKSYALYVFDVTDGNVYKVDKNGKRTGPLPQCPLSESRRNDGSDGYDMSKFEEMKAKFAPKEQDDERTVGVGSPRSRSGYCECSNPQIYGHGAYVGTLHKSKHKTQHLGMIGFVCLACGCPIKTLQVQAQEWRACQKAEGLPTQWYDLQMQYIEDMRRKAK